MRTGLRALSMGDKLRLLEDLWDSIAADQAALPLTDEQRVELDRRLVAYESDNLKGRESNEVLAAIKGRL